MTTTLLDSEIRYSRETRDYDILICGQIVGSAPHYGAAEAVRTRLLAERRDEGHDATAHELDASSDPFGDPRTDEEKRWDTEGWAACEGGWEKFGPHPFNAARTVRHFRPRLFVPDDQMADDFSDVGPERCEGLDFPCSNAATHHDTQYLGLATDGAPVVATMHLCDACYEIWQSWSAYAPKPPVDDDAQDDWGGFRALTAAELIAEGYSAALAEQTIREPAACVNWNS